MVAAIRQTRPGLVTERDHMPLSWARTPADLHGCTVVIGLTGDSADSGDLHG
jgi:hypothetical protein